MRLIGRVDRVERRGSFLEGREPEQALAVGEVGTRAGMLHDRWLATGEIARRPIAHPGVLELDEERLGAAPLAPGALDVGLIRLRAVGDVARIAHPPAVALDRKSTRLNSSHSQISYAVFCLKKKKNNK